MARRPEPPRGEDPDGTAGRQRLDKWLVYARFAKTRSVATALVEAGRVRVNGTRVTRPDRPLAPGDVLTLALPHATRLVRVTSMADRRGSATDAQVLYEDLTPDPAPRGVTPR